MNRPPYTWAFDPPPSPPRPRQAMVPFHGFNVPLIGVSPDATTETCDICHKQGNLLQIELIGVKFVCLTCQSLYGIWEDGQSRSHREKAAP